MNTLREVLKECNIYYHDIPSKLPRTENMPELQRICAVSVDFACLSMTVDHTYQTDFLSIKIVFYTKVTYNEAEEVTDIITKGFNILSPPQLLVKQSLNNELVPQQIDFVIRFENKYKIAMFLIHLMSVCNVNVSIL
jgi:hypothetical protein